MSAPVVIEGVPFPAHVVRGLGWFHLQNILTETLVSPAALLDEHARGWRAAGDVDRALLYEGAAEAIALASSTTAGERS